MNYVLWLFVLFFAKYQLLIEGKECVQRRLGACKVLTVGEWVANDGNIMYFKDLQRPPPEGFLVKTSIEINLLENKYSFENNLPVERKRPIGYNLNNAALVTIRIGESYDGINIHLGKKYYRLAELEIVTISRFYVRKFSRYAPLLPTFPYNLDLEITTNRTLSVYADGNTEPFLEHQLHVNVRSISFEAPESQTDLIAFVDCSVKYKPHCGSHRVDKLSGCRQLSDSSFGAISNLAIFQKTYEKDVIFNEFIVVDVEYSSKMKFQFTMHHLEIEFKVNSIKATLESADYKTIKSVRTEQWFEVPASPYAVSVKITKDKNNHLLSISNLRHTIILSIRLCEDIGAIREIRFEDPKIYFDCLHFDNVNATVTNKRPRKIDRKSSFGLKYSRYGFNYTKTLLDIRQFVKEPFVIYQLAVGNSTNDWCKEEPQPVLLATSKYDNDSLHALIERSNTALLSELKNINAQSKAVANNTARVDAVLTELQQINSELKSVKTAIGVLATHLQQNTTSVNYNQLNVTEFLNFLKQN